MPFLPRVERAWLPGLLALVAANLIPLLGVLALGWDLGLVFLLYWAESGIILFFSLIKLALVARLRALFMVPFTIVHGGIFLLVHLVFIAAFFVHAPAAGWMAWARELALGLAALSASHFVSFVANTVRQGALPKDSGSVMAGFYNRVMVMQVTIILGGFLAQAMGSPAWALGLLVALKTVADVGSHLKERGNAVREQAPPLDPATQRDLDMVMTEYGWAR